MYHAVGGTVLLIVNAIEPRIVLYDYVEVSHTLSEARCRWRCMLPYVSDALPDQKHIHTFGMLPVHHALQFISSNVQNLSP